MEKAYKLSGVVTTHEEKDAPLIYTFKVKMIPFIPIKNIRILGGIKGIYQSSRTLAYLYNVSYHPMYKLQDDTETYSILMVTFTDHVTHLHIHNAESTLCLGVINASPLDLHISRNAYSALTCIMCVSLY